MSGWRGWLCPLVPEHGPLLYIEGNDPRPWHCPHHGHHVAGTRSMFSTDEAERKVPISDARRVVQGALADGRHTPSSGSLHTGRSVATGTGLRVGTKTRARGEAQEAPSAMTVASRPSKVRVPTPGVSPETPPRGTARNGFPVSDGTPAAAARVSRRRSAVPSGSPGGALPAGGRGADTSQGA